MQHTESPESFVNGLLRAYITSTFTKYFELPNKKAFSFNKTNNQQNVLEANNLIIKPNIFQENHLPFQLKFGHIDAISIEIKNLESMSLQINVKGLYLCLKLAEEPDKDDAEVQERLRWIGYLFKLVSDNMNETGKTFFKRKLKIAVMDKLWRNLKVDLEQVSIWVEMENKACVGFCANRLALENNDVQNKGLEHNEEDYYSCKELLIDSLVFFYYDSNPLFTKPVSHAEAKKILYDHFAKLTYFDQFASHVAVKFTPGALNLPISGTIQIIQHKKRSDILTSNWTVQVKLNQLAFNLSPEKLFSVKHTISKVLDPFVIYYRIAKMKQQFDDFHLDVLSNAQQIVTMALKYPVIRARIKEKYKKKGIFRESEIVNVHDFKEAFDSKKDYSDFKNFLLNIDLETLYAATKSTFLCTSRVGTVEEKSLGSIFLADMIQGDPKNKDKYQNMLHEIFNKWYIDFLGNKDLAGQEPGTLENNNLEVKIIIKRVLFITVIESTKPSAFGPSNETQLESEFNEVMIHQTFKNWLGFDTTAMIESGKIQTRLEILARLGVMQKDKVKDQDSLKNLLQWKFENFAWKIDVEVAKRENISTMSFELGSLDMKEQVYSKNYKSYDVLATNKDKEEADQLVVNFSIDYSKVEDHFILKEGELSLYGLKIYDSERIYSYFDALLGTVPSFMKESKIVFPKEAKIAVSSENTFIKMFNKRPYYQTLGNFFLENSDSPTSRITPGGPEEVEESSRISKKLDKASLNLEGIIADRRILYEIEENIYTEISSFYEVIIEISLGKEIASFNLFHSPLKIVFNTRNLLHFFDEGGFSLDTYLPIPLLVNTQVYFEKIILIWNSSQTSTNKVGSSCLIIQIDNLQIAHRADQGFLWQIGLEKLEINQIEYYNTQTCISRRIYGDPLEPIYLPNTDFSALSSLNLSQNLKKSASKILERSRTPAIEIVIDSSDKKNPCFLLKVNNPKLMISFPMLQKLQESHNIFQVLRIINDEFSKQVLNTKQTIFVNEFLVYIPTNSKLEEDAKKVVLFQGTFSYVQNAKGDDIKPGVNNKSFSRYSARLSDLEVLITTLPNLSAAFYKSVPLKARCILPKLDLEMTIRKLDSLELVDDFYMLLRSQYTIKFSNFEVDMKLNLNDLLFLYETLEKEYKCYNELDIQAKSLESLLKSNLAKSNGLRQQTIELDIEKEYNIDLENVKLRLGVLNDMQTSHFPILEAELAISEYKKTTTSSVLQGEFRLHFYSLSSKHWEPIIEPASFVLTHNKTSEQDITAFTLNTSRTTQLNINLTDEFIDFLAKAYLLKEARLTSTSLAQLSMYAQADGSDQLKMSQALATTDPYQISPYLVHNISDMDLEVRYGGSVIRLANTAKQFIIKQDLGMKSVIMMNDKDELQVKVKLPQENKYYSVATINLEDEYSFKGFVLPFLKSEIKDTQPSLLVRSQKEGYYTCITFMTSIAVENNLPQPIKVYVGSQPVEGGSNSGFREYTLNPGRMQCIPQGYRSTEELYINAEGKFNIKENFASLVGMENNWYKTFRSQAGELYSIRKYRKDGYAGVVFLSIEQSLIIQNLVPLPIYVKFIEGNKTSHQTLPPNACQVINQAYELDNLRASFMLPSSFWSKDEKLLLTPDVLTREGAKLSSSKNFVRVIHLQDTNNIMIPLKLTCQKNHPNHIFISVDAVIVDKVTSSDIIYLQEMDFQGTLSLIPVQVGQRGFLKVYSKSEHNIFAIDAHFPLRLFKKGMVESPEAQSIDLNHIESAKEIKLEYKREGSEEIVCFPVTIRVAEVLLHKEAQITLKSYTVSPTYSFYNKSTSSLALQTPSKMRILNPGENMALDWLKSRDENLISLKQIFNIKEMSNKTSDLDIREINNLNLAFRNSKGQVSGITNVRKLNLKDRTQIIASNHHEHVREHLYILENKLPNLDIVIIQKGAPQSCNYVVKSGYRLPFAWDYPLKPKEIVVGIVNQGLRLTESTFNFHENIRTSIRDERNNTSFMIETVLDVDPSANLVLSFRLCNNEKFQGVEALQVFDKGNNVEIIEQLHSFVKKCYVQLQKVVISFVSQHSRKREETHRLYIDNLQLYIDHLEGHKLWNLAIKDIGLCKYHSKHHELVRFDTKGSNNSDELSLNIVFVAEEKAGKIAKVIKSFIINSSSLPRTSKVFEELAQVYHGLAKRSEEESIYSAKRQSSLANSILGLTKAITNKRKIAISSLYILQEGVKNSLASQILQELFHINQNKISVDSAKYIVLKFKNLRITEKEAMSNLINEIVAAGKAFAENKKTSLVNFVDSRPFFAEILDAKNDVKFQTKDNQSRSLLEGFATVDADILTRTLRQITEDMIKLRDTDLLTENYEDDLFNELNMMSQLSSATILRSRNPHRNSYMESVEGKMPEIKKSYSYSLVEGIKQEQDSNTTKNKEGMPMKCFPRILYGKEKALKPMKEEDASRLNLLQKSVGITYEQLNNLHFLASFGFRSEKEVFFVIFTGEFVFFFNETNKKVVWHIKARAIRGYKKDENTVMIQYEDDKRNTKEVALPIALMMNRVEERKVFEKTLRYYIEINSSM